MARRLISVTYGHGESGKAYDYETEKQYRAGDVVVVPVTHHKSKKTYNTLAVVMQTHDTPDEIARHKDALESDRDKRGRFKRQVAVKDVGLRLEVAQSKGLNVSKDRQVSIKTLPGYQSRAMDGNWSGRELDIVGIDRVMRRYPKSRLITRN